MLIIILRVQQKIKPYKHQDNNYIEMCAIAAGIMTLFCGMIFTNQQGRRPGFYQMALLILFISNMVFLIKWFFLFMISMNFKKQYMIKFLHMYATLVCQKKSLSSYYIRTRTEMSIDKK